MAMEDAEARVHVRSEWGENSQPRAIQVLHSAWRVTSGLIGHDLRASIESIDQRLVRLGPAAEAAEQETLDQLAESERDGLALLRLRGHIREAGYRHLPSRRSFALLCVAFLALVAGDWDPISTAFQVFGLSERPWIGFLKFSDPVHLAAAGSLFALLLLAHHAGIELSKAVHVLLCAVRGPADNPTAQKAPSPGGSPSAGGRGDRFTAPLGRPFGMQLIVPLVLCGGCLAAAMMVLYGVNTVRGAYLASRGVQGELAAFVEIQGGVFAAGVVMAMLLAHPFAREWADTSRRRDAALEGVREAASRFEGLLGTIAALGAQRESLIALAAHHLEVARQDTLRQAALYVRQVILSQSEPVQEELFTKDLPSLEKRTDSELRSQLIGITELLTSPSIDLAAVTRRREEIRAALARCEDSDAVSAGTEPREGTERRVSARSTGPAERDIRDSAPPRSAAASNGGSHR